MFIPKEEFNQLCGKIDADCRSIRRSAKIILFECGLLLLMISFGLGVQVGKSLCK